MRYSIALCVVLWMFLLVCGSSGAWSPYANVSPPPPNMEDGPELPFDPNDYDFLIYDCNGSEDSIDTAMEKIGIDTYTVCNAANPVTGNILADHDILIVSWSNGGGNKSGLVTSVIEQGITGRVILSGHDSDYHTANWRVAGTNYAERFFIQEIDYVLAGGGTGMIVCADVDNNFEWLPESWGVQSEVGGGSTVSSITQDGLDSGVYDDLTKENMSDWGRSYHNTFEYSGNAFVEFELGNGDLDVVTIATPVNVYGMVFDKTDDVNDFDCRSPRDEITYTIEWDNQLDMMFYDAVIIDSLPPGVTYPGAEYQMDPNDFFNPIPPDPAYDPNTHSYTWEIGDLAPGDANSVTLTLEVNEYAGPGMTVKNVAKLVSDGNVVGWASVETQICCWDTVDPNIIYVDQTATGYYNGTSWEDAYTDLSRAIKRATESACQVGPYTILVAQGVYNPGEWIKDVFMLPEGASLYGGFKSGGSDWTERNPDKYETVLTGYIGLDENEHIVRNEVVVMMGDTTRLDGFIVEESSKYGIYGEDVSFALANCEIADNERDGIFAVDGDVIVEWCKIRDNGYSGIYHGGQAHIIAIENCRVLHNGRYGLHSEDSTPQITNSAVCDNGLNIGGYAGVRIVRPMSIPSLYNNSIAYNSKEAVSFVDNDPNEWEREYPDIQNCILWYNNGGGEQMAGCDFTQYSCVFDPNDASGTDYTVDGYGNFSGNPGFAYEYSTDPNVLVNVHLAYGSPCIDMGSDLLSYTGQLDIDAEERVVGQYVDIGADEVYSCDGDLTEDDI